VPGNAVYLANDGKCYKADNDSTTAIANKAIGFAINTAADTETLIVGYRGTMRLDSWNWTVNEGSPIYLSATAGAGTETRPTSIISTVQQVATIIDADTLSIGILPLDFSADRVLLITENRVLTCLEATNTRIFTATDDLDITLPAVATCPTLKTAVKTRGNIDFDLDVNAADRAIADGTALSDGDKMISDTGTGEIIECIYESADGVDCSTSGYTDGN